MGSLSMYSCPGGSCPGGSCPGGSCPGGSCPDKTVVYMSKKIVFSGII